MNCGTDPAALNGNKRTGFAVASLFLELDGYHFGASEVDVVLCTLAPAAGEMSEADYAEWLKANSEKG